MFSRKSSVTGILSSLCVVILFTANETHSRAFVKSASVSDSAPATASLAGTVVDENDAVVPQANVIVTEITKQVRKESKTSPIGLFTVTELPSGSYTVSVRHDGFATAEIRNLPLKVNEQLALKIQLRVGQIGETVTIDADSSIVQRSPSVSTMFGRQMIENLPNSGRSLQAIVSLTPGVTTTKPTFAEQGQFSVNGQRASANYFMVDGVSANIGVAAGADGLGQSGAGSLPGLTALGTTHSLFSLDGVQELRILTNSYAPEFGRSPGAQVLVQSRAGGNEFRGSVFEYFRSGSLSANDWFANSNGLPKPRYQHHDFGATFGGPIIQGHSFFFLAYEGLHLRLPQVATVEVPSVSVRESAPAELRPFLNAFPLPNGVDATNDLAQFTSGYTNSAFLHAASIRMDQRFGEKLSLFGRYSFTPSETETRGGANTSLNTTLQMAFVTQTLTIGGTQVLSPKISHEFRANYSTTKAGKYFQVDDLGGAEPLAMVFPAFASEDNSLYSFSLGGNASFSVGKDATNFQHQLNLVDNLAIITGSHQLKVGFDYRRLTPVYGRWKYKQSASFNGVAGVFNGTAASVAIQAQDEVGMIFTNFSAYAQDTWKLSPRLTVTHGIRWELNPPPKGRDGQPLYTVQGLDNPQTLTVAPAGTPSYKVTYNNFAPRLGFAYQLSDREGWERVLRGGFGIFYDLGTGSLANASVSFPYLRRRVLSNVPYPLDPSLNEPLPFSLSPPVGRIRASEPNLRLPYTMQWNVTVEQSLGAKRNISASYVGAVGRRLLRLELLNNPNPDFGQVFVTTNGAGSSYHALQLQFQRRLSRRLQSRVAYTWSHSIDNASNDSFVNPPAALIDPRFDRASSDFDVRHTFAGAITYNVSAPRLGQFGKLLRDWTIDGILTARSAAPVDVFFSRDFGFGPFNFRPDVVPGVPLYLNASSFPGGRIINREAFIIPETPRQGTLARNALRGFSFAQLDLALHRRFALTERLGLQFGADIFNVFNHPNFGDPSGDLGSGLFGRSTTMFGRSLSNNVGSVGLNPFYQTGGPRTFQLSMRLDF